MDISISLEERGRKVASLLRDDAWGVINEYDKLGGGATALLINAIAFALDDEQPLLATGDVTDPETHEVEFAALTATRVLYFKGISKAETPAVKVIQRSALTELTVLSAPVVVPAQRFDGSGMARYAVQYGNTAAFKLPISINTLNETQAVIDRLLPSLMKDLSA